MYEEIRKNKTAIFDEKVKPVFEELIQYGYGYTALANALNAKGVLSRWGTLWTIDSVKKALKRLDMKTL
ncbi:recombinase family protein [Pantoea ananatis]|uniref:recombinase family protein n=1 Tax=Pantoea ananas TaxID=553 RepID=UPI0004973C22|nr:recombinase family protein [Pantoea ananatis]